MELREEKNASEEKREDAESAEFHGSCLIRRSLEKNGCTVKGEAVSHKKPFWMKPPHTFGLSLQGLAGPQQNVEVSGR